MSSFSTGLHFSRVDLQRLGGGSNDDNHWAGEEGFPLPPHVPLAPPLSGEERLMRMAAALRGNTLAELQPRFDVADEALRHAHRQIAALRQQLPCPTFAAFHDRCNTLGRRLLLFEEVTVQRLLKEAAEAAVATQMCEGSLTARWRKSNQWPALSNFFDLQLYICLTGAGDGTQEKALVAADAGSGTTIAATSKAIQHQLALLWKRWQDAQLRSTFLQRFYLLKDLLHGWGRGWRPRSLCTSQVDSIKKNGQSCPSVAADNGIAAICPWEIWETLSDFDRLMGFTTLCPQHLTESVVEALERSFFSEFADVWSGVNAVV
jgi:hypothetical protein